MESKISSPQYRSNLRKKLIAICPVCKKPVYGKDISILRLADSKINSWPINYVYCHSHNNYPLHALTIYLDSSFSARGLEVSDFIAIKK